MSSLRRALFACELVLLVAPRHGLKGSCAQQRQADACGVITPTLAVCAQIVDLEKHPEGYILSGSMPVAQAAKGAEEEGQPEEQEPPAKQPAEPAGSRAAAAAGTRAGSDGVIELLDDEEEATAAVGVRLGVKRKLNNGAGPSSKVQKSDVIELD